MTVVRASRRRRMNRWEPSPQKKAAAKRKGKAKAKAKQTPNEWLVNMRTMPYGEYLKSAHWKRTRAAALKHHGERCQKCGTGRDLQVHHLTYVRRGREKMKDLAVLCGGCHSEGHGFVGVGEVDAAFAAMARLL